MAQLYVTQYWDIRLDEFDLTDHNLNEFKALVDLVAREKKEKEQRLIVKESPEVNLNIYSNVSFSSYGMKWKYPM